MSEQKPRVLVVDDDSTIRMLLKTVLVRGNFDVIEAENGKLALEAVANGMPDLIFLDLKMPVMSGYEFMEKLKQLYGSSVPVVVISGVDDIAARSSEIGASDHLAKPFRIENVIQKVNANIAKR